MIAFIILAIHLAQVMPEQLAAGWDQIDIESYHGQEGYFHDSVSGALVEYYFGPMPQMLGANLESGTLCQTRTVNGVVPSCLIDVKDEPKSSSKNIHAFLGPVERNYAAYWSDVTDKFQEQRVLSLIRFSPLWERPSSGKKALRRDTTDDYLLNLKE